MNSGRRLIGRGVSVVAGLTLALTAAALAVRRIDGWPMWGRLPLSEHAVDEATMRAGDRPDRKYVSQIRLADGVAPEWYEEDPPVQLQAWITRQQLLPWVETRLADHRLPRSMRVARVEHPAFTENPRELLSVRAVKESCH